MSKFQIIARRLKDLCILPVFVRSFFLVLIMLFQSPTSSSAGVFSIASSTNIGNVSVMQVTGTESYFSLNPDGSYNAAPRNKLSGPLCQDNKGSSLRW
jgi:hypothetical protein